MKERGGGSIVNIGTVLIDHAIGAFPASAPLVSKGGVHALTVSLAAELAPDGIRVNAVAPGIVRTPLHGNADVDSFGSVALMNRVGEVDEITEAVLYLADATFTTGHILPVDGGFVTGLPVEQYRQQVTPGRPLPHSAPRHQPHSPSPAADAAAQESPISHELARSADLPRSAPAGPARPVRVPVALPGDDPRFPVNRTDFPVQVPAPRPPAPAAPRHRPAAVTSSGTHRVAAARAFAAGAIVE